MNKNAIYMVNIPTSTSRVDVRDYAQYSIPTWRYWCEKNNVDLIINETPDPRFTYPIWNKELVSQFVNGYEKVGIVDSDTMIRHDAPNIFETEITNDGQIYGVLDNCDLNWLISSIQNRTDVLNIDIDIHKYINAGVLFTHTRNLFIFDELLELYLDNKDHIDSLKGGGREQTLLNGIIQKHYPKIDVGFLSPAWNLLSIHKKNMFTSNWQLKTDPTPYFIKYAYVWHFTGFPIEERVNTMKLTWDFLKHNYQK